MRLTILPEVKKWLGIKNVDTITIGVIVSRGGGCCGGCSFIEAVIDLGKPREKEESHFLIEQEGLKVYIASIYRKKTDSLSVGLKGLLFKRLYLDGYETECPLSTSK
jgi:hypothetical protein